MGGWGPMFGTKSQKKRFFLTPSLMLNCFLPLTDTADAQPRWGIHTGGAWKLLSGLREGQTQVSTCLSVRVFVLLYLYLHLSLCFFRTAGALVVKIV